MKKKSNTSKNQPQPPGGSKRKNYLVVIKTSVKKARKRIVQRGEGSKQGPPRDSF